MLHEARHTRTQGGGWIEVIAGSMFSGKSEELIRRLRRARIARQNVQVFKPAIDDRYSADDVVSHSEQRMPSERVASAREILARVLPETQVVGIDEAQFLDLDLVDVCNRLADAGVRVVVAGLDQDYLGRPFEPMPQLLAVAEFITKARAICVCCGQPALRSQRLGASTERVVVGAAETYEPRCRRCYHRPGETEQPLLGADGSDTTRPDTTPPDAAPSPDTQVRIASASRPIL